MPSKPLPMAQATPHKNINHIYELMSNCKLMEALYEARKVLASAAKRRSDDERSWSYAIFAELELRSPGPRKEKIRDLVQKALGCDKRLMSNAERLMLKRKCAKIMQDMRGEGKKEDQELTSVLEKLEVGEGEVSLTSALEKMEMGDEEEVQKTGADICDGEVDYDGADMRKIIELRQQMFALELDEAEYK